MSSDRGMFDPNLPLQGIFDSDIFDTQLAPTTVSHSTVTVLIHSTDLITTQVHSTKTVTVK